MQILRLTTPRLKSVWGPVRSGWQITGWVSSFDVNRLGTILESFGNPLPAMTRRKGYMSFAQVEHAGAAGLTLNLAEVVSEAIFDIARLVEAARHKRFDPILSGGPTE